MIKLYSVEIPYQTRTNIKRAEKFKEYLSNNNIKIINISSCYNNVLIEIQLDETQVNTINDAIDKIIYYDCITETC